MVVEMLTFEVEPALLEGWLAREERVWSRFLERQPGFVRKEMWAPDDDDGVVMAVIWWETLEQWKAITAEAVAAIDAEMGDWFREPTMRAFRVVRDC